MKTPRFLFSLALLALLIASGCVVRSLHPLYTDKDLVFDEALVGTWTNSGEGEKKEVWEFSKAEGGGYKLAHTDEKGRKAGFSAHLLKLDDIRYADFVVTEPWSDDHAPNEAATVHLLPAHTFARVEQTKDGWTFHWFDYKWLQAQLEKNPKALSHYQSKGKDEPPVLTATTAELQTFLRKHGKDAFGGDSKMELVKKK